jgi:transposase
MLARGLAHLLRDATYAIECGDTAFSAPFKRLFLHAIAIGRRRQTLKDATLKLYVTWIAASLGSWRPSRSASRDASCASPSPPTGRTCWCSSNRRVPYTNNISERNLRPSVIFRKVTNGFRCE